MHDTFDTRDTLSVNGRRYRFHSLPRLAGRFPIDHLPYSLQIGRAHV